MGYDQHQQPNSSGTLVAVIGVGLVLAILGIIVVAAVGLFWVRASTQQTQAIAAEQRAIAELHRAEAEAQRAMTLPQLEQSRIAATPDARPNFKLTIDQEGNTSVDGEKIDLDELKAKLVQLKNEMSSAFSVHIVVVPECPIKHVIPVLDLCDEVSDIDYRITSSKGTDVRHRFGGARVGCD